MEVINPVSLGLIILVLGLIISFLVVIFGGFLKFLQKEPAERKDDLSDHLAKTIKPKIAFDGGYVFPDHKIISKDLGLFHEERISSIQNFIRSIPPTALELLSCPNWKWSVPPYNKTERTEGTP